MDFTRAIPMVLKSVTKHHPQLVADSITKNKYVLPTFVTRETKRKMNTGEKNLKNNKSCCRLAGVSYIRFKPPTLKPLGLAAISLICCLSLGQTKPIAFQTKGKSNLETANILYKEAQILKETDPDKACAYAQQAVKISLHEDDSILSEALYTFIGDIKRSQSKHDSSRFYYSIALQLARALEDHKTIADLLNNIGYSFQNSGNLIEATNAYIEALKISEENLDKKRIASAYNNLGFIYKLQKDNEQARTYYEKSLKLREETGDSVSIAGCYNNLGLVYMAEERYSEARTFYTKALTLLLPNKNMKALGMLYNNIGVTYENEGQLNKGREYYEKSISIKKKLNDERGLASTYGNVADNYLEDSKADEAIHYANMSLDLANKTGHIEYAITASKILAFSYELKKDYKEAFYHHVHFKALQDSLFNENKSRRVAEVTAKYHSERKEQENLSLRSAASLKESIVNKQQWIIVGVAASLGVVLLMLTFLFQQYKRSQALTSELSKQKRQIEDTNKQLEEVLIEKNNVLNVLAHDLRSPMNKVMGLTQLIKIEGAINAQQEQCLTMISEVADQGRRIINDMLLINREGTAKLKRSTFHLDSFMREVVNQNLPEAKRKQIFLHLEFPIQETFITTDRDYLSRILDNLISNAIKFSMPGKSVIVRIDKKSNSIDISVIDHGPGFTEHDKAQLYKKFTRLSAQPTAGETSTGLGLAIVKNLTHLIGGNITLESQAGEGATFIVSLPIA